MSQLISCWELEIPMDASIYITEISRHPIAELIPIYPNTWFTISDPSGGIPKMPATIALETF